MNQHIFPSLQDTVVPVDPVGPDPGRVAVGIQAALQRIWKNHRTHDTVNEKYHIPALQ